MLASSFSSATLVRPVNGLALFLLITVAGCSQPEIDRPGTWQPTGVNDQNLRAMLARPEDAYAGNAALTSRGDSGGRAVTRLLVDKRRSLLNVSVSKLGASSDAPADSGLPAGGSGGASPGGATQ